MANKLWKIAATLLLVQATCISNSYALNLLLINNTNVRIWSYVYSSDTGKSIGAKLAANGGSSTRDYYTQNRWVTVGYVNEPGEGGFSCEINGQTMYLDLNDSKRDLITITYVSRSVFGNVECTCEGSVCPNGE